MSTFPEFFSPRRNGAPNVETLKNGEAEVLAFRYAKEQEELMENLYCIGGMESVLGRLMWARKRLAGEPFLSLFILVAISV